MHLAKELLQFGEIPFSHGVLTPLLAKYRRPNDKISEWLANKTLIAVKRGMYVVNSMLTGRAITLPLVANQIHGPSYVSLDYALCHYGLIPESVHEVTSVTIRRSKTYDTPLGRFTYAHSPLSVYPLGIVSMRNEAGHFYLMASPEKALCDKLLQTANLSIHSPSAMLGYLEQDLRIDLDLTVNFDRQLLGRISTSGVKQRLLQHLCRALEQY